VVNEFKLNENITFEADEPVALFDEWLKKAENTEPVNPNACAVATADKSGKPSVRMVLLKGVDERGFVFYTNSESQKGEELTENPLASLCFYWKSLGREVRVDGPVEKVSVEEADAYFDSRARASQIGAWASKQSRVLESRFELEKRIAQFTAKFHIGKVPRPEFWEGYRVKHEKVEFWAEKSFRLHERFVYLRTNQGWQTERLYP
jgi:pyridoxamine 5'-phosphate oxidase